MNKLSLPLISLGKLNPLGVVPSVRAPLLREPNTSNCSFFLSRISYLREEFKVYFYWLHPPRRLCPDYTPLFRTYVPGSRQGYVVLFFSC